MGSGESFWVALGNVAGGVAGIAFFILVLRRVEWRALFGVFRISSDEGIRGPKSDTLLSEVGFPRAPSGVVRVREVAPHDGELAIYEAVRSMSGEAWERLRERMDARDQDPNEGPDPLFAKKTPLDGEGGGS